MTSNQNQAELPYFTCESPMKNDTPKTSTSQLSSSSTGGHEIVKYSIYISYFENVYKLLHPYQGLGTLPRLSYTCVRLHAYMIQIQM